MTNGTFLVDLSKLKSPKDVVADGLGSFLNNSNSKSFFYFSNCLMKPVKKVDANVCFTTTYYKHRYYPDFKKRIVTCHYSGGLNKKFALIMYFFDQLEHDIKDFAHGNSKRKSAYSRTKHSVKNLLLILLQLKLILLSLFMRKVFTSLVAYTLVKTTLPGLEI